MVLYAAQEDYPSSETIGTLSGIPSFDLEFDFNGKIPGQGSLLCKLPREASYRLRPFERLLM